MRSTGGDKRQYYRYAAVVFAVVFSLSAAFFFLTMWDSGRGKFPEQQPSESYLTYQGKRYEQKGDLETFLVLGLDKFSETVSGESYNNNMQADFLVLLVYDHEAGTSALLQINRDAMVDVNVLGVAGNRIDTVNKQIALAHTYGNGKDVSCRNTADAVSGLLMGIKIDHYISVKMDAVPLMNDLVGGVEVTVLEDFTGIDDSLIKGETVTLMGQQALTYVRGRYGVGDSTNATRMARQQQYMEALQKKVRQCMEKNDTFVVEAAVKISEHIVSDRSVNQLQELADRFYDYEFSGQLELEGTSKLGEEFMEFYPDAEKLQQLVIGLFYQEIDEKSSIKCEKFLHSLFVGFEQNKQRTTRPPTNIFCGSLVSVRYKVASCVCCRLRSPLVSLNSYAASPISRRHCLNKISLLKYPSILRG